MNHNPSKQNSLEDIKVNIKIKLSALWAAVTLCYLYGDYFELYIPGKVKGLTSGKNLLDTPQKLLMAAVLLAIPAMMVLLSVILRARVNRILNITLGLFFSVLMLLIASSSLVSWRSFYVFLALTESLITMSIVWHAWKWPKHHPIK